ncbi:DEAD/DEAH box helicase [Naumannella halotolerans]|uniref:ATP-dependent RNA helicase DeaD n=1 Tax=Naumannella halotolerans TaxID=993414 RepID=A0A4R7J1Q2_9ACTN|nr:DEAD/DEAH box helicase [Naumannella halotolerans]TDT31081.1 ATP-dependent RNA helicase DeaD [Naumannella halotolerans]
MNTEHSESSASTFAELGLGESVLQALSDVGYETPSAIQARTIPPLLEGRDVVGLAQTGTGKTAAFALPLLDRIDPKAKGVQALVLAPTRELALQVSEAFESYAGHSRGIKLLAVYGGQGYGVQLSALRRGVQVVVGTPGRVMDHLDRGTLDLSNLRHLVLDEADEMLNMGFAEDVEKILADTPSDKQVALFSATMPRQIRKLAESYLHDPVEITVESKTKTADNIAQRYLVVSFPQKVDALTRILEVENFDGAIVFVRTKHQTEEVAERLRVRGFSAEAINGDVAQAQRERTVNRFKRGDLDLLIATDVAARGLDVDRISHVINFDIPTDPESYVHRIGRTGRAGRSGDAISFVTPRETYLLRQIERATKQPLTEMTLPNVEQVNETRLTRFDDKITAALSDPQVETFRDVIDHYVRHHDVPVTDVAAALAVAMQGDDPLLLNASDEIQVVPPKKERAPRQQRDHEPDPRGGARTTYKINVGRRHKVEPRQIVGAIANEGGLSHKDFGRITIRMDHSLVELPAELPKDAWEKLARTRISGRLIEMQRDSGAGHDERRGGRKSYPSRSGGRDGGPPRAKYGSVSKKRDKYNRDDRGPSGGKKPRHKGY